jgi:hypothetical protein
VKRLAVLAAAGTVVLTGGVALAAWTIGSIGASGRGAARTLPPGPAPTITATGSTVTVSFSQVTVGISQLGALTGGGYTVKRYSPGGAAQTTSGSCSSTVSGPGSTLSCTEINVPEGTWTYRVTPVLSGWKGGESSGTVTVDTTPPVVTVTLFAPAGGGGNTKVTAAGTGTIADGKVKVYVCRSTPCSSAIAVNGADPAATTGLTLAGTGWTYTSSNLGSGTYYLVAQQTDAAGNTGTSTTAGPVTR